MHGEELALDQVGLGRLAQPDGHVGRSHRQIELLVGGDQREMNVGIKLDELAQSRREPMHADAGRSGQSQLPVRPFAAVGELGARRLKLA